MPTLVCTFCLECLSKTESVALHCGHTFHESCLVKWYARDKHPASAIPKDEDILSSKPCPTCRQLVYFHPVHYTGVKLFFNVHADETTDLEARIAKLEAEVETYKRNEGSLKDIKEENRRLRDSVNHLEEVLRSTKSALRESENKCTSLKTSNVDLEKYIDHLVSTRDKALKDLEELTSEYRTVSYIKKILHNKIPADMDRLDKRVLCKVVIELRKQLKTTSREARIVKDMMKKLHYDLLQKNKELLLEEEEEFARLNCSKRKSSDPCNSDANKKRCHVKRFVNVEDSEDDETLSLAPKSSSPTSISTDSSDSFRHDDEVLIPQRRPDSSSSVHLAKLPKTFSSARRLSDSPTSTSSSCKSSTSQQGYVADTVKRTNPIQSTSGMRISLKPCMMKTNKRRQI